MISPYGTARTSRLVRLVSAIARICEPSGGRQEWSLKQPPFEYLKLPNAEAADFVGDFVPLVGFADFLDLPEG